MHTSPPETGDEYRLPGHLADEPAAAERRAGALATRVWGAERAGGERCAAQAANLKSGASRRALVVSGSADLPLYTTEPGDTLDKVARAHHTTVQDLMQANGARYLRSIGAPGGQLEQGRALFLRKVPGVPSPAAMHSQARPRPRPKRRLRPPASEP